MLLKLAVGFVVNACTQQLGFNRPLFDLVYGSETPPNGRAIYSSERGKGECVKIKKRR